MAEFLNDNVKHLRNEKNISQQALADKMGVDRSTVSRIENGEIETTINNAIKIANALNVSLNDLVSKDLRFDNALTITDTMKIPIYGSIKAGLPLESQNDIVDYMDVPSEWSNGKNLFGLKLSGDSMFPKYNDGEIVIFKQEQDLEHQKNKDCAIMINHTESTFKKLLVNDTGIVLQAYNPNYDIMMFTTQEVQDLPIIVLGIAIKKVSDIQ